MRHEFQHASGIEDAFVKKRRIVGQARVLTEKKVFNDITSDFLLTSTHDWVQKLRKDFLPPARQLIVSPGRRVNRTPWRRRYWATSFPRSWLHAERSLRSMSNQRMPRSTSWRRKSIGMFLKLRKTVVRSFNGREGGLVEQRPSRHGFFRCAAATKPTIPFSKLLRFHRPRAGNPARCARRYSTISASISRSMVSLSPSRNFLGK